MPHLGTCRCFGVLDRGGAGSRGVWESRSLPLKGPAHLWLSWGVRERGGDLWSFANVAAQLFCRRLGGWGGVQGRGLGFNEENEALGLGWEFSEVLEVL